MSSSGSGRYACAGEREEGGEAVASTQPNPTEAGADALREVPWFREPDVEKVLEVIHRAGLTFCWRVDRAG